MVKKFAFFNKIIQNNQHIFGGLPLSSHKQTSKTASIKMREMNRVQTTTKTPTLTCNVKKSKDGNQVTGNDIKSASMHLHTTLNQLIKQALFSTLCVFQFFFFFFSEHQLSTLFEI